MAYRGGNIDDSSKRARYLFRNGGLNALLCLRNARPQKALAGRAQWKSIQPPIPEEITGTLG